MSIIAPILIVSSFAIAGFIGYIVTAVKIKAKVNKKRQAMYEKVHG